MQGPVRWYSHQGFGFIAGKDIAGNDRDYYFHVKDVIGQRILKSGEVVNFDLAPSPKGVKAVRVQVV